MVYGEWIEKSAAPKKYIPSYLGLSCAINGYRPSNKYDGSSRENHNNHFVQGRLTTLRGERDGKTPLFFPDANRNTLLKRNNQLVEPRSRSLSSDRALNYRRQISTRMESPHRRTSDLSFSHLPHRIKMDQFHSSKKNFSLNSDRLLSRCDESQEILPSQSSIQERIERLYGSSVGYRINKYDKEEKKKQPTHLTNYSVDEFPSVFRHLTPEFRHQLPMRPKSTLLSRHNNNNIITTNNNIRKEDLSSTDTIDCFMNGQSTNKLFPVVSDRMKKRSFDSDLNKSFSSLRHDIQPVNKDCSSVKNIANDLKKLDLNKNINSLDCSIEHESTAPHEEQKKDGFYFLKVVESEVASLERNIAKIDEDLSNEDEKTEEVKGKLFATSGKAKLLIKQKIHQFKGLCQKNIDKNNSDEFPTTDEDLAGFWDMVLIQVENVKQMFSEIEALRNNNWNEVNEPNQIKDTKKKSLPKVKALNSSMPHKKPESKEKAKMNEERRRQMRESLMHKRKQMKKDGSDQDVQIFM